LGIRLLLGRGQSVLIELMLKAIENVSPLIMGIYLVFLIFIRTYIINIYSRVFVKFLLLLISSVLISQTAYCLTWKEVSFTRIIIDKKMRMLLVAGSLLILKKKKH
jgi:hypothetical protein